MKLMHPLFSRPIEFQENRVQVLTVEQPVLFRDMLSDLLKQSEGEEGAFVLSEEGECLDPAKYLYPIADCFHLDQIGRKMQVRLMHELLRTAQEKMPKETADLTGQIQQYFARLILLSEFPVEYEHGENLSALLKAMDIRVDLEDLSVPEALCEHISLYHQLMGRGCVVLVRVKDLMTPDELRRFYQMAGYQKWNLLLLEAHGQEERLPEEQHRLFDRDLCELILEK